MSVFDDILGSDNSPRKRGRPRGSFKKPPPVEQKYVPISQNEAMNLDNVYTGVSIDWLSKVFRMSRQSVVTSLAGCPTIREGSKHYELATAAAYLVDPLKDLSVAMKNLKAEDLPERIRESFWNAKIKEMKYRAMAGELWPTESVMEVFSDTFQLITSKTKLWVDDLEEISELSDAQRHYLNSMVDELMGELKEALVTRSKTTETESYVAELDA